MKNKQQVNGEAETQKYKKMVKTKAYYMKEIKKQKQKTQIRTSRSMCAHT